MEVSYNVTTALGLVNTASLVCSGGWLLCARQAWRHRSPLATFASVHLAVITPAFYLSLPFQDSWVYAISNAWSVLFYNIAFVSMGLMLVGRDLESKTATIIFVLIVYATAGGLATLAVLTRRSESTGSDGGGSHALDAYYFFEPVANAACLLWFVMISFYRYALCCLRSQETYFVFPRWAALLLQLSLTGLVFGEKVLLYMAREGSVEEITWRATHWARATATQGWLFLLSSRSRRSVVLFAGGTGEP